MVEKIDRPEVQSPYYVQASAQTKDDQSRKQQQQSDEYSGSHASPGWQKVYAGAANRKYLKIRREDVVRAIFRKIVMVRGISLAEADIELRGGRVLSFAQVVLAAREDFWTLKKFAPGQEIPFNYLLKEPIIEISIPAMTQTMPQGTKQVATAAPAKKGYDLNKIIKYAVVGGIVLLLLIFALTR